MSENFITEKTLREFLLGRLDDEERARIEDLFLTDNQARENVLTAEQDLIEDYLEDSLSKADKERFLSLYARTDEQRRKLRITKTIKDRALGEVRVPQIVTPVDSIWTRFRRRLQLKPVAIAATVVLAIVLAIVWLNSRMEQRKHLAVEQELAQLNSPTALREIPSQMIALKLSSGTRRSLESQSELNLPADNRIVEFRLPWIQKERYSTYQAEVRDSRESFTIPNLQAEDNGEYLIRLRLRSKMLHHGNYRIRLTGIANDGSTGITEEYNFAVVR